MATLRWTNSSPGLSPTISLAGTRLSEQPIQRYSGACWEASLRMRYLGPYAMTPDNAQRASSKTSVNVRGAYRFGSKMLYAEIINLFDSDGKDIVYWYEAYVDGFDPPGLTSEDIDCDVTNCRMSRAEEPRTLRFGLKWEF